MRSASDAAAGAPHTRAVNLSDHTVERLRCPACGSRLSRGADAFTCIGGCARYPVVSGVPVLIDEKRSVFSVADFVDFRGTFFTERGTPVRLLDRVTPRLGRNLVAGRNFARCAREMLARTAAPKVLVLGGSIAGEGMEPLLDSPGIELVESDVSHGPRTRLICDAHDIPFADGTFDGVVAQAVLEHVLDPWRCVAEIHRVLKPEGLVYAETPFMYPVHGRCYDFTRFTRLGHRRLFRAFSEIDSGAVCGPGMALAYSWQYFLLSFSSRRPLRKILQIAARCTAWGWKYFDPYLADKDPAFDAAPGFYFIGKRADSLLSDRDLLALYRGGSAT